MRALFLILLIIVMPWSSRAWGASRCETADLRGNWDVYAFNNSLFSVWTACEAKFASTGQIVRRKTLCINNLSTASTLSGTLSVDRKCRVSGRITQQAVGAEADIRIVATLNRGRDTFFGVGNGSDGTAFIVQGTKR